MQLLYHGIFLSFLITTIILNQIPKSSCADVGFGMEWNANNTLCDECRNSGGYCGYDPSSSDFTCYCRGRSFPSSCRSGQYPKCILLCSCNKSFIVIHCWFGL